MTPLSFEAERLLNLATNSIQNRMDNDDEVPVLSGMGRGRGRGGVPVLPAGITSDSAIKVMMIVASRTLGLSLGPTARSDST